MPTSRPLSICWLRRDLRLHDHAPLALATAESQAVAVVFILDRVILDALENSRDRRLTFIHRSLCELDSKLRAHGSMLIVRTGDPAEEIPQLAQELGAKCVYTGKDYEPYARTRDAKVAQSLFESGIDFVAVKDSVVREGGEVLSQERNPLRVYTPYRKSWERSFEPERDAAEHQVTLAHLVQAKEIPEQYKTSLPSLNDLGFEEVDLWLSPGEDAALEKLGQFAPQMHRYRELRDFPAAHATSGLSVHLRFGTISVRKMVRLALSQTSEGAETWLREIIWRDFYQDILFHFPDVVERPFQRIYDDLEYPGEQDHFSAWCEGKTGYPLVDAAMRCFNATGWMHNRLRMVVASFLTKDLLIDYRQGEAYFAAGLLDFDLASNNGGWQWASSVGADPQPYFRIFNPILQSVKFDPEGKFIREWCPELSHLEGEALHFPARASEFELLTANVELGKNYPKPIVDHATQKERAISLLAVAKSTGSE